MSSISRSALVRRKNIIAIGETFGRLEVAGEPYTTGEGRKIRVFYPCRCICGVEKPVRHDRLKAELSPSCGCGRRDAVAQATTTHGGCGSRLYNTRSNVIQRCHNPNFANYADYGGRGITVCQEWRNSFEAFRDWATANGYQDDLEIDREDNDGPYSPENCRWTTRHVQTRNTRRNNYHTAFGETKCIADWAKDPRCTVTEMSLRHRLKKWDFVRALTTPVTPSNKRYRKMPD